MPGKRRPQVKKKNLAAEMVQKCSKGLQVSIIVPKRFQNDFNGSKIGIKIRNGNKNRKIEDLNFLGVSYLTFHMVAN